MSDVSINLFPGAIAMVFLTVIYTLGSALAAGFQHLLFKWNGKQVIYVSLMSVSIFVSQLTTICHQIFSAIDWPNLQIELYKDNLSQWKNPDASIVYKSSPNLILRIIFAIRMYFFNVESLLFFFWALMLFISVWEIESKVLKSPRFISGTKILCFVLPGIQAILTHIPALTKTATLHLILLNFIMITTLSFGSIFLLLILFRCAQVMWNANWTNKMKFWGGYDNGDEIERNKLRRTATMTSTSTGNSDFGDRYILIRFIAGFIVIGGLQASFLLSQYVYAKAVWKRKQPDAAEPLLGWTSNEQVSDWAFFLAGSATGYLILIVFGTTRESRMQVRRLWANFRQRTTGVTGSRNKNRDTYLSFRDREYTTPFPYPESPERKPKPTIKPINLIRPSSTSPVSSTYSDEKYSSDYEDVSLKTPRKF